jgi:meso-butanediol dehydrogenase / (S,S)-butanediol dehydrogenase / diacetyl reductase
VSLAGSRALVTGGSSGIGAATARALAVAGARVAVCGRDRERVDAVARDCGGLALECDVREAGSVDEAVERTARELGGLDVVVAAAGLGRFAPTKDQAVTDFDEVVNVNLRGTFLVFRAALPHVLASRGHLFALASIAAVRPFASSAAYCAAKAGTRLLAQVIAEEHRRDGLRVTTLVVGSVDTPFWDRAGGTELPRDRMLRPEQVAAAIVSAACASDGASLDEIVLMPPDGVL